jgi:hypothetical protein
MALAELNEAKEGETKAKESLEKAKAGQTEAKEQAKKIADWCKRV